MSLYDLALEGIRSLWAHKLRSGLSMLGIVIGIYSIVLMLALGQSVRSTVNKQLEMLGTNLFMVSPNTSSGKNHWTRKASSSSLSEDDVDAVQQVSSVVHAAPVLQTNASVRFMGDALSATVVGTTSIMPILRNWVLEKGVWFDETDLRRGARVAIVGKGIADSLFAGSEALYKQILVDNVSFEIIGVLENEGKSFDGNDLGYTLVVPISSTRKLLNDNGHARSIQYMVAQAISSEQSSGAQLEVSRLLRVAHRLGSDEEDDFAINDLANVATSANTITSAIAFMFGAISAISLFVGGIGIMNMMLVSVTERTREIGVRLAIGASERSILLQFLIEACLICLTGACIGVLLAWLTAMVISAGAPIALNVSVRSVLYVSAFACTIGVVFGLFPARRASRLCPIECLRVE
ncbi:MAG: ABC transporter permease [Steroidobacteraceae bacterium]